MFGLVGSRIDPAPSSASPDSAESALVEVQHNQQLTAPWELVGGADKQWVAAREASNLTVTVRVVRHPRSALAALAAAASLLLVSECGASPGGSPIVSTSPATPSSADWTVGLGSRSFLATETSYPPGGRNRHQLQIRSARDGSVQKTLLKAEDPTTLEATATSGGSVVAVLVDFDKCSSVVERIDPASGHTTPIRTLHLPVTKTSLSPNGRLMVYVAWAQQGLGLLEGGRRPPPVAAEENPSCNSRSASSTSTPGQRSAGSQPSRGLASGPSLGTHKAPNSSPNTAPIP